MKRIILAIAVTTSTATLADTATEIGKAIGNTASSRPAKAAAQSVGDAANATMWQSVCNGDGNLSHSAHCYMTPDGRRAWEYPEGPKRLYWLKLGKEQHKQYIQRQQQQHRQDAAEAERMYKVHKMNSQLCDFWQDQEPSGRRSRKIEEHCG